MNTTTLSLVNSMLIPDTRHISSVGFEINTENPHPWIYEWAEVRYWGDLTVGVKARLGLLCFPEHKGGGWIVHTLPTIHLSHNLHYLAIQSRHTASTPVLTHHHDDIVKALRRDHPQWCAKPRKSVGQLAHLDQFEWADFRVCWAITQITTFPHIIMTYLV